MTRFDSASFSLNDPPETTAAAPAEPDRVAMDYNNPVTRTQPPGPYGAGAGSRSGVERAALPDATPDAVIPAASPPPMQPTPAMDTSRQKPLYRPGVRQPVGQQVAMAPQPSVAAPAGRGDMIEVQPGDTLYGLSRRHQVSLAELMNVNGLVSPDLKPGQKLYLPAGNGSGHLAAATPPAATPSTPPAVTAPAAPAAAVAAAPAAVTASPDTLAKYNGEYTVKPGDSIYAIARAHKVPFTELQQVNGISNPLKVRPGAVLKVPAGHTLTAAATPAAVPMATAAISQSAAPAAVAQPEAAAATPATSAQPTILNSATPAETVSPVPPAASAGAAQKADKVALATPPPETAVAESKLRWPAQGRIIAGFGGRPDGTHNDGINLAVPQGTEVHSAESGVVAYAGSELKGYGNLVLVRHDNGWVTAYAHNEELLVKRGDKVKRGQVIAKAGATGTVDQPQVHFELRQGSKPVDPTPFMERL